MRGTGDITLTLAIVSRARSPIPLVHSKEGLSVHDPLLRAVAVELQKHPKRHAVDSHQARLYWQYIGRALQKRKQD